MAPHVFLLAVIPSPPVNGIHLVPHLVLATPPAGQRRSLTAAISALAALAMVTGRLTADPRDQPPGHSTR